MAKSLVKLAIMEQYVAHVIHISTYPVMITLVCLVQERVVFPFHK